MIIYQFNLTRVKIFGERKGVSPESFGDNHQFAVSDSPFLFNLIFNFYDSKKRRFLNSCVTGLC